MPYCCQCGTNVGTTQQYCSKCGTRQPIAAPPPLPRPPDILSDLSPRTASLLCYIPFVGWLAAIVVLASAQFRQNAKVRFDAFQGFYLFVAWLIVQYVLVPLFSVPFGGPHVFNVIPALCKATIFGTWIFMIVKASHEEQFKLPILGELAEKSLVEQR
jgi:uncharacterized membrane protein